MAEITVKSTMAEILEAYPGAQQALHREFHIGGCSSCGFEPQETLQEVLARYHVLDYRKVLDTLRATEDVTRRLLVSPAEARGLVEGDHPPALVDLRDGMEHAMVRLAGSLLLDHDLSYEILHEWPKDRAMLVYCHRGEHALEAAVFFEEQGFTAVRALRGGLDAWSQEVDPDLPRYGPEASAEARIWITGRPEVARFRAGTDLLPGAAAFFTGAAEAAGSPLAERLFAFPGVVSVGIAGDAVTVTRDTWRDWRAAARRIARLLEEHEASGQPAVAPEAAGQARPDEAVAQEIQHLLDCYVNPAVAGHGGSIRLVEYRDHVAHLEMGGGCQGCGAATMTLRQGVETLLREKIPEILEIRDATDHAAGLNPYY